MRRYRSRLDNFIRSRVPAETLSDLLRMAERSQLIAQNHPEMIWDYTEMREVMLDFVTTYIAADIFDELKNQFWFDETFVTKDMVAERCLTHMILGPAAMAAE